MKTKDINLVRRKFLLLAGCAPAIGIAAVLGRSPPVIAQTVGTAPLDAGAQSGYHETDHIRKYYYYARHF